MAYCHSWHPSIQDEGAAARSSLTLFIRKLRTPFSPLANGAAGPAVSFFVRSAYFTCAGVNKPFPNSSLPITRNSHTSRTALSSNRRSSLKRRTRTSATPYLGSQPGQLRGSDRQRRRRCRQQPLPPPIPEAPARWVSRGRFDYRGEGLEW